MHVELGIGLHVNGTESVLKLFLADFCRLDHQVDKLLEVDKSRPFGIRLVVGPWTSSTDPLVDFRSRKRMAANPNTQAASQSNQANRNHTQTQGDPSDKKTAPALLGHTASTAAILLFRYQATLVPAIPQAPKSAILEVETASKTLSAILCAQRSTLRRTAPSPTVVGCYILPTTFDILETTYILRY